MSCTNCGTELLPDTRFCRQCGQRSAQVAPGSVTEATTRTLKTPGAQAAFEQQYYPPAGGPLAPQAQTQMISGAATNNLAPARPQSNKWLYIVLTFAFVALLCATLIAGLWSRRTVRIIKHPPAATQPEGPITPPAPPAPPAPQPAQPTAPGDISDALIYPGAQTTLDLNGKDGRVLQLQTTDPMDKVVNWYTDKLKLNTINRHSSAVTLQGDNTNVVITSSGSRTSIIITQGTD